MTPRCRHRGFTLLEMILAISLAVGLLGALYGFYDQVSSVRHRVLRQMAFYGAERQVMDRLTGELQSAVPYPFLGLALEGQVLLAESTGGPWGGSTTRFFTTMLPGPAAWAEFSVTETPPPPEHDVQWVGYSLQVYQDEEGLWHNGGLVRSVQRLLTSPLAEEGEGPEAEIVVEPFAPEIKFFYVQYYDGQAWTDAWIDGTLPMAVEVVLGAEELPEGMDVLDYLAEPGLYPVFRRTIYLPGGTSNRQGTVIVDGPGGGRS